MQVDILYVPQCPGLAPARSAVEGLAQLGAEAGSPTILIDGRDPFTGGAEASVSCRLYRSERRLGGAPSVDELLEVLSR